MDDNDLNDLLEILNTKGDNEPGPEMNRRYDAGPFVLYTSDDYSSFMFGKKIEGKKVPKYIVIEMEFNDDKVSEYYGFGQNPNSIVTIIGDKASNKVKNFVYYGYENMPYPNYELLKTRYEYHDTDGDGQWDHLIDIKNEKGYKNNGITWELYYPNTE